MTASARAAPPARAETISSRDNRWLKRFRAALRGSAAASDANVGVEGARLVEEALRSGLAVEAVLVSASGERHLEQLRPYFGPALTLLRTSDRLFAGIADTQSPQGVAALLRAPRASFDDIVRCRGAIAPLVVVLVGVQDPGNVGTILRAAEAFGATGTATTAGTAHHLAPKALRASAGSALRLPVLNGISASVLLAQLRVAELQLYAASPNAHAPGRRTVRVWEADLRGPAALLVGNEGAGLPAEIERSVDMLVHIPLATGVDSLNAAVAASVLLYEAARQRRDSA